MKEVLAAFVALFLVIVMVPGTASAVTIDPNSSISDSSLANAVADDGPFDIFAGPHFWNASFDAADAGGAAIFDFFNSSAATQTIGVTVGTILQSIGAFTGGVTVSWLGGESVFIAQDVTDTFSISTTIAALGSDTLSIVFGDPTGDRSTIDVTVQAVPLPAPFLLLLSALGGLGFISYRRRSA